MIFEFAHKLRWCLALDTPLAPRELAAFFRVSEAGFRPTDLGLSFRATVDERFESPAAALLDGALFLGRPRRIVRCAPPAPPPPGERAGRWPTLCQRLLFHCLQDGGEVWLELPGDGLPLRLVVLEETPLLLAPDGSTLGDPQADAALELAPGAVGLAERGLTVCLALRRPDDPLALRPHRGETPEWVVTDLIAPDQTLVGREEMEELCADHDLAVTELYDTMRPGGLARDLPRRLRDLAEEAERERLPGFIVKGRVPLPEGGMSDQVALQVAPPWAQAELSRAEPGALDAAWRRVQGRYAADDLRDAEFAELALLDALPARTRGRAARAQVHDYVAGRRQEERHG